MKNQPADSARLKVMIHKGRPRLFAVDGRQEAANEEAGVRNRGFIHAPQILIALFAERIGIEVDHVAVDEVVGGQALQDPVDTAVADVAMLLLAWPPLMLTRRRRVVFSL